MTAHLDQIAQKYPKIRFSLAPMEGVVDATMRHILTRVAKVDLCVTEFLRVTTQLYPNKVFYKNCPELLTDSHTASGVPVVLQLLGGQPTPMAENAARAVELGAIGIDLNFGCPAKTVNNSDGGAALLQYTDRLYDIVAAVRRSVPDKIPVTAKMRLGFNDRELMFENARAIEAGGAEKLTIHGRTKKDGYKPPADWEAIKQISDTISIPVVPNGDIGSVAAFEACHAIHGATEYMLGRGLLANPGLIRELRSDNGKFSWSELLPFILEFQYAEMTIGLRKHQGHRLKQWLAYLKTHYAEAAVFFEQIKRLKEPELLEAALLAEINKYPS
ncbi:tRNA-dihydrouridine synthase [uncultured Umboniibacter sp.]|uniref:tRNA dihydrouridine synthase n=1 Tax=uncultured Umboniibacter sp. TaxID=1798917 RepID=UPI00260FA897|nr:tRNA-dihydrouridine synthase [uncultured Umboniibacter sp.]